LAKIAGLYDFADRDFTNLRPFDLCLAEGDAISQIVVATISSPPTNRKKEGIAIGQREVGGNASNT
jgi:hypothetical protein